MPTTTAARPVVRRRPGPDLPAIRLRSAPALEPPYDDEVAAPGWAGPGVEQMAFDLGLGAGGRHTPPPRAPGPARATTGASAETVGAVRRFVRLCLEIFNGYRPAGHIRPLTSPSEAANVIEQVGLLRELVAGRCHPAPAPRDSAAPRSLPAPHRRPVRPARGQPAVALRRTLICEPRGGVAEAAVVLGAHGGRSIVLAVRLEYRRDRWLCTAARAV